MIDQFLARYNLQDPEDFDALLELASLVRELIRNNQTPEICRILRYTLEHGCHEAFSWCVGLLQEDLEKAESALTPFDFTIGTTIPDYNEFVQRLQVDFNAMNNGLETVLGHTGEIESFFNILVYRTGYKNVFLVSSENFDNKDNDYIQYKLSFTRAGS